jgi:hypothetical protein
MTSRRSLDAAYVPAFRDVDGCSWTVGVGSSVDYIVLTPTGSAEDAFADRRRQTPRPTRTVPGLGDEAYYDAAPELCSRILNVRDDTFIFIVGVGSLDGCASPPLARTREKLVALAELVLERQPR